MIEVGIIYISYLAVIVAGVIADIKVHKIPNKLILCGLVAGILYKIFGIGDLDIADCLSMLIPFVLLYPIFCLGMLGAGDIKFMCMMAVVMKPMEVLYFLLFSFGFGAVWAGVKIFREKSLRRRFQYLKAYVENLALTGTGEKYFSKEQGYQDTISFALPIALSFLVYLGGGY